MIFTIDMSTPVPTLKMHGAIGKDEKVNFADVKNALDTIKAGKSGNKAHMDIHSGGGNMGDGLAIMDAIVNSGLDMTGHIGGIAGSMAFVMLLAIPKEKLTCSEFAQGMTHRPSGVAVGESDSMRASADLQDDIENKVKGALVTRTGLPAAEINNWFKPGVMNWMNADKMLQYNIVGAIKPATAPNAALPDVANKTDVEAFALYNHLVDTNQTTDMSFKKTTFDLIGLPDNSGQDAIEARVLEIFNENTTLKNEKVAERKKRAETLVANAIKAKKITAADSAEYIKNATDNYDFVANTLDKIKGAVMPNSKIKDTEDRPAAKGRDDWDLTTWRKKDPTGLAAMRVNEPEVFNQLVTANLEASGVTIEEKGIGGITVGEND